MRGTFFPVCSVFICVLFFLFLHVFFSFAPFPPPLLSLSCCLCSDNISANTLKPCASIKKIKLSRVIYSNADVLRSHIVCMPIDRLTFYWESLQTTAHIYSCYSIAFLYSFFSAAAAASSFLHSHYYTKHTCTHERARILHASKLSRSQHTCSV